MRFIARVASPMDQFRCEVLGAVAEILETLPEDVGTALDETLPTLPDYRSAARSGFPQAISSNT